MQLKRLKQRLIASVYTWDKSQKVSYQIGNALRKIYGRQVFYFWYVSGFYYLGSFVYTKNIGCLKIKCKISLTNKWYSMVSVGSRDLSCATKLILYKAKHGSVWEKSSTISSTIWTWFSSLILSGCSGSIIMFGWKRMLQRKEFSMRN